MFLEKRVRKWCDEFQGEQCKVRVLKAKLAKAQLGSLGDLNIQVIHLSKFSIFHFFAILEKRCLRTCNQLVGGKCWAGILPNFGDSYSAFVGSILIDYPS